MEDSKKNVGKCPSQVEGTNTVSSFYQQHCFQLKLKNKNDQLITEESDSLSTASIDLDNNINDKTNSPGCKIHLGGS